MGQTVDRVEGQMMVYDGVVQDRVVILPEGVQLANGVKVEVRVRPLKSQRQIEMAAEDLFKRRLVEAGLLREPKAPYQVESVGDRAPVQVAGRPVSEMIIEERR